MDALSQASISETPLKITVFYGSMRSNRLGIRAVKYMIEKLQKRGHEVTLVDAMQENLPLLDQRYSDYPEGKAPQQLERLRELYQKSEGFLVVAGEYNSTLQPGLKNLLDYFFKEYFHRPSAIVSYSIGSFGGVRATSDLRVTLGVMGMPAIPSVFVVPKIDAVFDEQAKLLDSAYGARADRFLNEFEWYAGALKKAREQG
ncbi:MAG: NADPH-dependent FMN reductase [Pseudomonadota bacterium]